MGYLQIKSTNPEFSFMLEKNPASGMQCKKLKKGILFYWFSNNNTFDIHFMDSSNAISYLEHQDADFEYSNTSKFNNARLYCDMFQEVIPNSKIKDFKQDTAGFTYSININLIETQFKTIDIFQKYFFPLGIEIISENIVEGTNNYKVSLSTNTQTFKFLSNVANFFTMIASLNSNDFIFITDDFVEKYIEIANRINAPYFLKYLIKVRMIRSAKRFELLKEKLEKSDIHKFEMTFGDTHDARIAFIKEKIFGNNSIIDIGSGIDYRYARFLAKKTSENNKNYYAIDTDEDARFKLNRFITNENLQNVSVYDQLDKAIEDYKFNNNDELVDILCTEVLEHNSQIEARLLIIKVLNQVNINKFVITVPNVDFNIHYATSGQFRHPDHKWEISFEAFKTFINECVGNESKFEIEYFGIGDKVDDISVSSGCIITKKII